MREEAAKRGMTLADFSRSQEEDDTVDRAMDALVKERSEETGRGVFEGRVTWHFVVEPKIKVFLSVDPKIAAERILGDADNPNRDKLGTLEEIMADNALRKDSETTRYKNYYGISAYDHDNFDIVVDTSEINADEVFEQAVIKIAKLGGS